MPCAPSFSEDSSITPPNKGPSLSLFSEIPVLTTFPYCGSPFSNSGKILHWKGKKTLAAAYILPNTFPFHLKLRLYVRIKHLAHLDSLQAIIRPTSLKRSWWNKILEHISNLRLLNTLLLCFLINYDIIHFIQHWASLKYIYVSKHLSVMLRTRKTVKVFLLVHMENTQWGSIEEGGLYELD